MRHTTGDDSHGRNSRHSWRTARQQPPRPRRAIFSVEMTSLHVTVIRCNAVRYKTTLFRVAFLAFAASSACASLSFSFAPHFYIAVCWNYAASWCFTMNRRLCLRYLVVSLVPYLWWWHCSLQGISCLSSPVGDWLKDNRLLIFSKAA